MKKILLKFTFIFATVLFYQNTYAAEIMDIFSNMDIFPTAFRDKINTNFEIVPNGEPDVPSKKTFAFHKSKELKWSVNSTPCASNKKQRCIGIYEQPHEGQLKGNQANLFSDILSDSTYTLLKIDKTDSNNNAVYKCKSKYNLKFAISDSASINNCATYTKNNCKAWNEYLTNNKDSFTNLKAKADQCDQIEKEVTKFSTTLKNTFTVGFNPNAKTDISVNFHSVTEPQRGGLSRLNPIRTDTNIQPLNINSSIFVYNDITEKTKDCAKFADFFNNPFNSNASTIKPSTSTAAPSAQGASRAAN